MLNSFDVVTLVSLIDSIESSIHSSSIVPLWLYDYILVPVWMYNYSIVPLWLYNCSIVPLWIYRSGPGSGLN